MASVTGFTTPSPSVRRPVCRPLRFEVIFAGLCLRDAPAFFEAVFVDREVVFAAARARPLPPRDLEAAAFAGFFLRDDAALFFDALLFDAPVRPRLAPPRDFEAEVFLADLAIHNSFDASPNCGQRRPTKASPGESVNAARGTNAGVAAGRVSMGRAGVPMSQAASSLGA
jgi:hypothetical protein